MNVAKECDITEDNISFLTDPKQTYDNLDDINDFERYDRLTDEMSVQFQMWHDQLQSIFNNRQNRGTGSYSNQDSTESLQRQSEGVNNQNFTNGNSATKENGRDKNIQDENDVENSQAEIVFLNIQEKPKQLHEMDPLQLNITQISELRLAIQVFPNEKDGHTMVETLKKRRETMID